MGLPRQLPPANPSSGHGPFGDKAFKGALIACAVLLVVGAVLVTLVGGGARPVGASFLVLGGLGLGTGAAGLLAERLLHRRPPPPDISRRNGRGPYRS
jgi:hypothetical protein